MNRLGPVSVGGFNPVRIMGIINTSPESFFKESIITDSKKLAQKIKEMENEGANFVDVGGNPVYTLHSKLFDTSLMNRRIELIEEFLLNIRFQHFFELF